MAILGLCSCSSTEKFKSTSISTETPLPSVDPASTPPPKTTFESSKDSTCTSVASEKDMTAAELTGVENYLNDIANNGFVAFRNTYTEIADVDLTSVFYNGAGICVNLTDKERNDVYNNMLKIEIIGTDCFKYPKSKVDAFIKEKTGLAFDSFNKKDKFFPYVAKYDAYYDEHGDTNFTETRVISGQIDKNGLYVVNYKVTDSGTFNGTGNGKEHNFTVTLRMSGSHYQFVSNVER